MVDKGKVRNIGISKYVGDNFNLAQILTLRVFPKLQYPEDTELDSEPLEVQTGGQPGRVRSALSLLQSPAPNASYLHADCIRT